MVARVRRQTHRQSKQTTGVSQHVLNFGTQQCHFFMWFHIILISMGQC